MADSTHVADKTEKHLDKSAVLHVEDLVKDEDDKAEAIAQKLKEFVVDENVYAFRQLDPPVTEEEIRKVRRKIDLRLPPFVCLIYITTWLDRGNIGNAALMGIKEDIGLSASTYSLVVAMFFIGTCCGDLFTNIGMRLVRPSYWISGAMVLWGAIATLMAATYNPAGMLALRFFLGIGEAAFICGAPYVFTFWYPREEWGRRVCIYLAATPLAGAFGGWIAYGIAHIKANVENWRLLFIIEGLFTVAIAVASFYVLPDRPHNTKWLTPREREVAEWRMLNDGNRTHGHFNISDLLKSLLDWRMLANIGCYMCQVISTYTIATFTPIIVNSAGYDTVKAQLMVAPPYAVAFVCVFIVAQASDRLMYRARLFAGMQVIAAAGYLILCLCDSSQNSVRYGSLFLIIPATLAGVTLSIGNISDNVCGDIKKGCAIGLFQSFGSTMGIATGYLLPAGDAPLYRKGFWSLFAVTVIGGIGALIMSLEMDWENKRRDKKFGKPRKDTIYDFSEVGEKHPYWRFTP